MKLTSKHILALSPLVLFIGNAFAESDNCNSQSTACIATFNNGATTAAMQPKISRDPSGFPLLIKSGASKEVDKYMTTVPTNDTDCLNTVTPYDLHYAFIDPTTKKPLGTCEIKFNFECQWITWTSGDNTYHSYYLAYNVPVTSCDGGVTVNTTFGTPIYSSVEAAGYHYTVLQFDFFNK